MYSWVLGIENEFKISNLKSQIYYLISFFFLLFSNLSSAQCAMCRAALESEESGIKAEAVNDGIVYLMIIPYVLVAVLFYFIYRLRKKK
jgi:Na+/H+ antiporter NhaC